MAEENPRTPEPTNLISATTVNLINAENVTINQAGQDQEDITNFVQGRNHGHREGPRSGTRGLIEQLDYENAKAFNELENLSPDFPELKEPTEKTLPDLYQIQAKEFYQGNCAPKQTQYQKEGAFDFKRDSRIKRNRKKYEDFKNDLLTNTAEKGRKGRRLRTAVVGQAGAGKSYLIRNILKDVSSSENRPEMIIFRNFRDLPREGIITPWDLLFGNVLEPGLKCPPGYDWLLQNQDKAILFLDGLDQAGFSVSDRAEPVHQKGKGTPASIISNLLKGTLLPGLRIVYTSREHAVAKLSEDARPDDVITMTGLSVANSEKLFKTLVGEKGEDLWTKILKNSHSVLPILSIPVFLLFTATVCVAEGDKVPNFVTAIMRNVLEYFKRCRIIQNRDVLGILNKLKRMSYKGMKGKEVMFLKKHLDDVGLALEDVRDWMIQIPGKNKRNQFLVEGDFIIYFSHQILQEILTAEYIAGLPLEEFRKIVMSDLTDGYWAIVTRFLSGILLNTDSELTLCDGEEVTCIDEKRIVLKEMLTSAYTAAKNTTPAKKAAAKLAVLPAIAESNDSEFIRGLVDEIDFPGYPVGVNGMLVISSIMRHCTNLKCLHLPNCNLNREATNILWDSIKQSNVKIAQMNVQTVRISDENFDIIGSALEDGAVLLLSDCPVTSAGLQRFSDAFAGKKLQHLNLRGYVLSNDTDGRVLGSIMGDQSTLETVDCGLNTIGLRGFKEAMEDRKIYNLNIGGKKISTESLGEIIPYVVAENGMFGLRDSGITTDGLKAFLDAIGTKKIYEFDIAFNKIDEEGAAIIAEVATRCAVDRLIMMRCHLSPCALETLLLRYRGDKISHLDISGNNMTNDMAVTTANIVKQWSVDSLVIQECKMSDDVLDTFLSVAKGIKLSYLDVEMNSLSKAAITRIKDMIEVDTSFTSQF